MLKIPPPVPNNERQRQFRERNPGYYTLQARAARRARMQALRAEQVRAAAQVAASAPPVRLALPAPVEAILIPGMTTIRATPAAAAEPLPIAVPLFSDTAR